MSPSHLKYPGPEWSHGSPSRPNDSKSSPDPLFLQHDLASPREEPKQPKPVVQIPPRVTTSDKDLDCNQLRSQHLLFIDPAPGEPQLQLPLLQEPQLCAVEGDVAGSERGGPRAPLSLETNDKKTEFRALISRPDDIQSVENIHAEGFNFSANNLRQTTDSMAKGHRRNKQTQHNASSSQPTRPSQSKADSGVLSHHPIQDGGKADISVHQDLAQVGESKLAISADVPQDSSPSIPSQSECSPSEDDQAAFPGLHLPVLAHASMNNKPANRHESLQATLIGPPSDTSTQIANGKMEKKHARLKVVQSSKIPARSTCQIEHQGPNTSPGGPGEVPLKMSQHGRHHASKASRPSQSHDTNQVFGSISQGLGPGSSGKHQFLSEGSLFQAGSHRSPPANPPTSVAAKRGSVIEQEVSHQTTGVPFPSAQYSRSTGEQRVGGPTKARDQSQAPFHDDQVPETDFEQASASSSSSRSVNSQKRIPDAIPDLTFTHSTNKAGTPPKGSTAVSTKGTIDEKDPGTGSGCAQRQSEKGHSSQNHRREQDVKRGRTSNISTESQKCTAMISGSMHSMPHGIRQTYDHDHNLHSSPPNISKRRDNLHKLFQRRKKNATPMTPSLTTGLNMIAEDFNSFYAKSVEYEERMMSEMHNLEQHISSQDRKIARLRDNLEVRDHEIAKSKDKIEAQDTQLRDLVAEKEATGSQAQEVARQLADSNTKAESLREKCQILKHRFNEGLAEQQRFYVKNREHCDKVLNAAQQEKQAREQAIQDVSRACEETMLNFQKSLEAAKKEAFAHTALLEKDVSILQSQLETRQRELSQANGKNSRLEKEIDEARLMNTDTIQTLVSQNAKMVQMMEAHQTQPQAACHSDDNQNQMLEEITKALQEVESRVSNPSNLLDEMKSYNKNLTATVVARIGQMTPSQPFSASDKDKWAMKIDHIHQACANIWDQIRDDHNAEEIQQRYYDAQWRLGDVVEDRARVQSELDDAMQWNSEKVEENDRLSAEAEYLRGQVENLQKTVSTVQNASQEADQISNEQAEMLEARLETLQRKREKEKQASDQEVQRLKGELQEKETTIKVAEEKRKTAEEQLDTLRATFQQKEAQLESEHRAFEEGLEKALRRHEESMDKELGDSLEENAELQSRLQEARAKIRRMSSERQTTDTEFEKLQKLVGDGVKTANELKAEIQNSQKTQTFLSECLVEWTRDHNKLESLKTWEAKATEKVEQEPETNVLRLSSFKAALTEPLNVRQSDRRATLRSPQEDDPKANPLSVIEERDARRQFDPPKSIMRMTRQTSKRLEATEAAEAAEKTLHIAPNVDIGQSTGNEEEEPAQKQVTTSAPSRRRAVTIHSSYNRPVEGNASRASDAQKSEKKRSMTQYNQGTGLEEAVSGRGEAKRPKIGGKTSRSVSKHTPQTDDTRMAEVDFETAEKNGQTRMASEM